MLIIFLQGKLVVPIETDKKIQRNRRSGYGYFGMHQTGTGIK